MGKCFAVPGFQLVCTESETALRPLPPCYITSSPPLTGASAEKLKPAGSWCLCSQSITDVYNGKRKLTILGGGVFPIPIIFTCVFFFLHHVLLHLFLYCLFRHCFLTYIALSFTSPAHGSDRHRDQQAICTLIFFFKPCACTGITKSEQRRLPDCYTCIACPVKHSIKPV